MRLRFGAIILLAFALILTGCRESNEDSPSAEDIEIELAVEGDQLAVGEANLLVTVRDADGDPVDDANVNVRGDMNHAGMTPVIRDITESTDGIYTVPFEWTMGGDWIVDVTVTLDDDESTTEQFEYTISGEGPMDMADMDMTDEADMSEMDMTDEPEMDMDSTEEAEMSPDEMNMSMVMSAAYMQLTNNGDADDALIRAEADFAAAVELHQSTVDDQGVARMTPQEMIAIPAGETTSLEPGGYHVMFIDVQEALEEGDTVELTLVFESGEEVTVPAIVGMEAAEGDTIEAGNISIEGVWVRPANVMAMEMEATEEAE